MATTALLLGSGCGGSPTGPSPPGPPRGDGPSTPPPPLTGQTVVVAAVGDIGLCGSPAVEQTAQLVDAIDGQVLLAGDLAYSQGSMSDFLRCFDPLWGSVPAALAAVPRQPRVRDAGRLRLLSVLRRVGRHRRAELLLVSRRRLAGADARFERPDRRRLVAIRVRAIGADVEQRAVHAGRLAPSAVHVGAERTEQLSARSLDAALRPRRRRGRERPRSSVRAIRQAGRRRPLRRRAGFVSSSPAPAARSSTTSCASRRTLRSASSRTACCD